MAKYPKILFESWRHVFHLTYKLSIPIDSLQLVAAKMELEHDYDKIMIKDDKNEIKHENSDVLKEENSISLNLESSLKNYTFGKKKKKPKLRLFECSHCPEQLPLHELRLHKR